MISLIITVKNERAVLPLWLESIKRQTLQPDEVVVVDGGSTDGTFEWLESVKSATFTVLQKKGNIAVGRNIAIQTAKGEIIVATDAGCLYSPEWLQKITDPLTVEGAEFCTTAFQPWFEAGDSLLMYLLASATTPRQAEFARDWLPSSRSVAFTKNVWQRVGGYPEWIPFCEDVIFDLALQKRGTLPHYVREPLVSWRPRPSIAKYMRQLYNYTRSDAHGKLFYGRQVIRYSVYGGLTLLLIASFQSSVLWLWPIILGGVLYMHKFWLRLLSFSTTKKIPSRILGVILLPVIIGLGDVAKMTGFFVGLLERWSGKIRYQQW
jgi:glycosyltransferase involved in cell wall biosynthesis